MSAGRKGDAELWITEESLIVLEGWAREGLTDKQIAENKIGISERTFCKWKNKYPSIRSALKKGKLPVDYEVEKATLKMALGYKMTLKKPIKVKTVKQLANKGRIEEERIEYVDEEIYVQPNSVNQIFWLKNRMPDKWRDKPEPRDETALNKLDEILRAMIDNAVQRKAE